MGWLGRLDLRYTRDGERTIALDRHEGPLRVLQRLYPEGPTICHHVLVHPPGGVAGGDVLEVDVQMDSGTHAVITTPGATRFYRSENETAIQKARLTLLPGARLEWLPLETLAYSGCLARNDIEFTLGRDAQLMGWDVLALGLPAAAAAFERGRFEQRLHWPGHWLERGVMDASDTALLDGPLGWAGKRVLGTLWVATGTAWERSQRDALVDAAREALAAGPGSLVGGCTSPTDGVVLLRILADRVEPLFDTLCAVRLAWRTALWALPPHTPRIWRT